MIFRAFFWDFDGTLYDSYGRISRCCQRALSELGIDVPLEDVYRQVKITQRSVMQRWGEPAGVSYDRFMAVYRAWEARESPDTMRPYAGVGAALRGVVAGGGQNYLYTHRGVGAYDALAADGLRSLFADGVTSADGFPSKPSPDALIYLMRKHCLAPEECVMLGDRDIDCDAGKNAGMHCVLFDPENFYPDYQTQFRFRDMDALRRTLLES